MPDHLENPFANYTNLAQPLRSCFFFCSQQKIKAKLQNYERELNEV